MSQSVLGMENIPELSIVLREIQALYHDSEISGKEKASAWLGSLQTSVYAWKISDQLLMEKRDMESCYFAAQTMRSKIQHSFHELPVEAHISLRDSLINHISNVSVNDNTVIVTQLCLALADLALQMVSWQNVSKDLIERFSVDVKNIPNLLEVLTVLPEEINSRTLRLGENRRKEIDSDMSSNFPLVFQFLNACCEHVASSERHLSKVFRCLGSWLGLKNIQSVHLVQSNLLVALFQTLANVNSISFLHEAATDCICAALLSIDDLEVHLPLAKELVQGVFTLSNAYHLSVAQEESDKSLNYCRIFTELAESLLENIVETPGKEYGDLHTLDLLLACVSHPDYELSEVTFHFWYRLSEALFHKYDDNLNCVFKPYIERLIFAVCHHCCLEPDSEKIPDERDDFSGFRKKVTELIKDVVFIVGSKSCIHQMFQSLKSQSMQSWESSEAILFIITAVATNILPQEKDVVPEIVNSVINSPELNTHIAIKYTNVQLLGELCQWIESNPTYLEPILKYLLESLHNPQLGTVSANALRRICKVCQDHMAVHFDGLLELMKSVNNLNISQEAIIGLLEGTAFILSKMPIENLSLGLKQLCFIQVSALMEVLKIERSSEVGRRGDPIIWLDRLSAIFRYTNSHIPKGLPHPGKEIIQDLWPVLSSVCTKYQNDITVIERCCRCIRFLIRYMGKQSAIFLQPLVQQMVEIYQVHHHSCFLYLGSILVDEYGSDPGCIQGLIDMLMAFSAPTFRLLEGEHGLRNHPDIVDDLFRLCIRFVQRAPVPFLQCTVLNLIIDCAFAACSLEHKDANSSVMNFFKELFKCSRIKEEKDDYSMRHSYVLKLFQDHGQVLINNLIQAPLYCLPSYMIIPISQVILELMLVDRPSVCKWLEATLKSLPKKTNAGVITATDEQLVEFHSTVTKSMNDKEINTALKKLSRFYS